MNGFAVNWWFISKCGRGNVAFGLLGWCLVLVLGIGMTTSATADPPTDKSTAPPAVAKSALNVELAKMASRIKEFLQKRQKTDIAVGEFTAPDRLNVRSSPAIKRALIDELKALKIEVTKRAEFEVAGEYFDINDPKGTALRIRGKVLDKEREPKLRLDPGDIFDPEIIATILGVTVAGPTDATPAERTEKTDAKLKQAIQGSSDARPFVKVSQIFPAKNSEYAIEILAVDRDGKERKPRKADVDGDGFCFVKFEKGESYVVNLINKSPYDAAVKLTIDGLNVFQFSENREYTHWIVPAGKPLVVEGWHRSNKLSDRFQVKNFADCPAAKELKSAADLGTITATFARAWAVDGPVPPGEDGGKGEEEVAQTATGRGAEVETPYIEVQRKVGQFHSSVSVRYDKAIEPVDLPTENTPAGKANGPMPVKGEVKPAAKANEPTPPNPAPPGKANQPTPAQGEPARPVVKT